MTLWDLILSHVSPAGLGYSMAAQLFRRLDGPIPGSASVLADLALVLQSICRAAVRTIELQRS